MDIWVETQLASRTIPNLLVKGVLVAGENRLFTKSGFCRESNFFEAYFIELKSKSKFAECNVKG